MSTGENVLPTCNVEQVAKNCDNDVNKKDVCVQIDLTVEPRVLENDESNVSARSAEERYRVQSTCCTCVEEVNTECGCNGDERSHSVDESGPTSVEDETHFVFNCPNIDVQHVSKLFCHRDDENMQMNGTGESRTYMNYLNTLPHMSCPGVHKMYVMMADVARINCLMKEAVMNDIAMELASLYFHKPSSKGMSGNDKYEGALTSSAFITRCLERGAPKPRSDSPHTMEGLILLYDVCGDSHCENLTRREYEASDITVSDAMDWHCSKISHCTPVLLLHCSIPQWTSTLRDHYESVEISSEDDHLLAAIMATFETSMARNTVQARANYTPCLALIDTGAVDSCVSAKFFAKCTKRRPVSLDTSHGRRLHDASGNNMTVLGRADMDFHIAGLNTNLACQVVEGLAVDVILGLPFLKENRAQIDCDRDRLVFHDGLVASLLRTGTEWNTVYPLTPINNVTVQPNTIAKIPCKAPKGSFQACFAFKYLEHWPLEDKHLDNDTRQSVITSTLSKFKHPSPLASDWDIDTLFDDDTCCLTVINTSDKKMEIWNDEILGHCEPLDVSRMFDVGIYSVSNDSQTTPEQSQTTTENCQTDVTISPTLENENVFTTQAVTLEEPPEPIQYQPIDWMTMTDLSHLSPQQQSELIELLDHNRACFAVDTTELGLVTHVQHHIKLLPDAKPFRQRPYRLNVQGQVEMERQVEDLPQQKIIEPSIENQWCSAAFLVRMKDL